MENLPPNPTLLLDGPRPRGIKSTSYFTEDPLKVTVLLSCTLGEEIYLSLWKHS